MEKVNITHDPEMYENIFNAYRLENDNGNQYVFYNILNKVTLPNNIDNNVFDKFSIPGPMPLTTISYKIYKTMHLWWLIMVCNNIKNPVKLLAPGAVIRTIKPQYLSAVLNSIKQR
jgi:hypothetical protein